MGLILDIEAKGWKANEGKEKHQQWVTMVGDWTQFSWGRFEKHVECASILSQ